MAEEYDLETTDFWQKFPRTFLDKFIEIISTGGKVLDIGSGPGRDGSLLKEAGLKVTCIDASEAMVKLSSEKGLDSICGDFMNLPFPNQSFSGAWAYTSLLHVPKKDIDLALDEIKIILFKINLINFSRDDKIIIGNTVNRMSTKIDFYFPKIH